MISNAVAGFGGWNPAFAKLLQPAAKKQKLNPTQVSSMPLNGMQVYPATQQQYVLSPLLTCRAARSDTDFRHEQKLGFVRWLQNEPAMRMLLLQDSVFSAM